MKLRSRKRLGEPLKLGNDQTESKDSSSADSNLQNGGSESDEEWRVLSDSTDSDSSVESEMDEPQDIMRKNHKAKGKVGIVINETASTSAANLSVPDHAEPSNRRSIRANEPHYEQQQAQPPIAAPVAVKWKKCYSSKKKKDGDKPTLLWELWEEENERWIDQHLKEDIDMDHQEVGIAETTEAPKDLIIPLLRYQKEWLAWALKQEESPTKGGILADEMGMGKTLQAIALVLAKRDILHEATHIQIACKSSGSCSSIDLSGGEPTLVVCPLVAVSQWVSEIDRFTTKGSTKVLVYHGANRERNSQKFSGYDFVITTYSTVESEFRKYMMPPKTKCVYCGKSFYGDKLSIHLKYFCGPDATRTAKQSKQSRKKKKTVPMEPVQQTRSGKRKSHGPQGVDDLEYEQTCCRKKSILHSLKWGRIILDEAHYVKDRRCNTAKAVFALDSYYKWALSGTPLQNRVGELYSLVRFLQIVPYSYYLCKDCDCQTLDYRQSAQCGSCDHSSVRHFCWWNKYVSNPVQAHGTLELGRRAMVLLKHKVLGNIVLRRTKKGRAADLALPPRIVMLRRDALDVKEEDYYQSLYSESQSQFNTYVNSGTVMNNYAHIFDLLTRLRQAVDHPYLVVYSKAAAERGENLVDSHNVEQVCGICHDPVEDPIVTSCSHIFCKACLLDFSASLGQVSCPTCSCLLTVDFTNGGDQTVKPTIKGYKSSSIINRIQLNDFQTSTKIEALREEIRCMVERDGSAKGIVFSQFTSFLDLISYSLSKSGVKCVQLVGSMTLSARDAAIKKFIEEPDCRIFLMSLKAGGVALNLTVASHVFLMDPWWNPAVERQAQDRIHRIGQYKPIRIVRFVIKNTIEERILKLQDKKELVFEGTVGSSSEAFGKLTEADLRFLFVT